MVRGSQSGTISRLSTLLQGSGSVKDSRRAVANMIEQRVLLPGAAAIRPDNYSAIFYSNRRKHREFVLKNSLLSATDDYHEYLTELITRSKGLPSSFPSLTHTLFHSLLLRPFDSARTIGDSLPRLLVRAIYKHPGLKRRGLMVAVLVGSL